MKTTKALVAAVLLSLPFVFTSCHKKVEGSGNIITAERILPEFTDIKASGSYDIVITHDSVQKVEVKTDDNILDDVVTKVDGTTLEIYFKDHHWNYEPTMLTIYIHSPLIDDIKLSGSGNILSTNQLVTTTPEYTISGSGNIDMNIVAQSVETNISGSGNVDLVGVAPTAHHTISGSGNINALNLNCDDVWVTISGSGDAHVHANNTLDVTISGSGNVHYTGSPQITSHISGSGNVGPE